MKSVKVLSWVPHEPRRALPVDLLYKMANDCDTTSFRNVNFILFISVLYYTFSRSECPCPKNFSGMQTFDEKKHWMVRDFQLASVKNSVMVALKVRFKAIKQDPRIERPTAKGDGSEKDASKVGGADWSWIGDVPSSPLSVFKWLLRHIAFFDVKRPPTDPMFLAADMIRPYTYACAMADLHFYLGKVSEDTEFGIHGIRVEGYNNSKRGNGVAITVANGLWSSEASASRYDRWDMFEVCSISAGMEGVETRYKPPQTLAPRVVNRDPGVVRGHGMPQNFTETTVAQNPVARRRTKLAPLTEELSGSDNDVSDDSDEGGVQLVEPVVVPRNRKAPVARRVNSAEATLPPGWSSRSNGRKKMFCPPPGGSSAPVDSLQVAWKLHHALARISGRGGESIREGRTRNGASSSSF